MALDDLLESCFRASAVDLTYVQTGGRGLPLVFLHGAASRWQPFRYIFPLLGEHYHIYALNMRGHSGSGHTPGAYRLPGYAADVHEFITQLVGEPAVVYGHSLGSLVAIGLAAQHPEDVRCLVLSDPPLYHHDTLTRDTFWLQEFQELYDFVIAHPDPVEMDAWLAQNFPNMTPERRQERVLSLKDIDPGLIRAIKDDELMADTPLADLVPRVQCPVLLLHGEPALGSALRPQDIEYARHAFPSIRLLEVKGSGHSDIKLLPLLPQIIEFIDSAL